MKLAIVSLAILTASAAMIAATPEERAEKLYKEVFEGREFPPMKVLNNLKKLNKTYSIMPGVSTVEQKKEVAKFLEISQIDENKCYAKRFNYIGRLIDKYEYLSNVNIYLSSMRDLQAETCREKITIQILYAFRTLTPEFKASSDALFEKIRQIDMRYLDYLDYPRIKWYDYVAKSLLEYLVTKDEQQFKSLASYKKEDDRRQLLAKIYDEFIDSICTVYIKKWMPFNYLKINVFSSILHAKAVNEYYQRSASCSELKGIESLLLDIMAKKRITSWTKKLDAIFCRS